MGTCLFHLKYIDKKVKNGSWSVNNNCAYFAATAWEKAGQKSLENKSEGGYSDPAILYYSIANSYRKYDKYGEVTIGAGMTEQFDAAQEWYGSFTIPFANSFYE